MTVYCNYFYLSLWRTEVSLVAAISSSFFTSSCSVRFVRLLFHYLIHYLCIPLDCLERYRVERVDWPLVLFVIKDVYYHDNDALIAVFVDIERTSWEKAILYVSSDLIILYFLV